MRVVFDTNIFVAAFIFPGSQADAALHSAIEGRVRLCISRPIILETLDVLARKFDRQPEQLARVAVFLAEIGEVVKPGKSISILADEPDNRILECAVEAGAELVVTGDKAMLALKRYKSVDIVSLRAFLACS